VNDKLQDDEEVWLSVLIAKVKNVTDRQTYKRTEYDLSDA